MRTPQQRIVFGAPVIEEEEIAAVTSCLQSGWIGQGKRVEELEHLFAQYKGAPHAVALSSGTAALHLSLVAMGIGPGDEVIAPSMTFCSSVHSIVHAGATHVLVDCDPATYCIDPNRIEERITPRTRAILVVHMGGRCCDMDPILELARKYNLRVIEDCAHAIESSYHGRPAGLMGDAGCFSFYATKNMACGDGGMVITSDRRLARRVKLLALHGMTSDAWCRMSRSTNGYRVPLAGFKANLTDLAASLAIVQLRKLEARAKRREELWRIYSSALQGLDLCLPAPVEPGTRHAYHLYSVRLAEGQYTVGRRRILAAMRAEGVGVGIHYVPVHRLSYYRRMYGYQRDDFPQAAAIGETTFSLPLSAGMTHDDATDVCVALRKVLNYYGRSAARPNRIHTGMGVPDAGFRYTPATPGHGLVSPLEE